MKNPKFRMSTNVALHSKKWKEASTFYKETMGLDVQESDKHLSIQNGPIFMYVQENPGVEGVVMEYFVDDLDEAKAYLEANGCTVVKWEGRGKDCYMKDPFGLTFNLWENELDKGTG